MFRIAFLILMTAHGLIHTMGFIKAFHLAEIPQLAASIPKLLGLLWLLCSLLFITSVIAVFQNREWWWLLALPAIILSQFLIILTWHDAKFGTIINLVILAGIIFQYGIWSTNQKTKSELDLFLPQRITLKETVSAELLLDLPPVVQKWLKRTNIIGQPFAQTVHLHQIGKMKTAPDKEWMQVEAEQWFTVDNPGFIWEANVGGSSMIRFYGRDKYQDGQGHMLIKLCSLFPVVDARGAPVNQGALVRYLAETIWFPSAALNDYITWKEVDDLTANATIINGGLTVSGIFRFNTEGDAVSFEAPRYFDRKEGSTLETWFINIDQNSYSEFKSIRIPVRSSVTWKLREGDFNWYKLEITKVVYNEDQN